MTNREDAIEIVELFGTEKDREDIQKLRKEEAIEWLKQIKNRYIHGGDERFDESRKNALDMAIKSLENTRWIPCSERLPEEIMNPITQDYYEYLCTADFGYAIDTRAYKFGGGHWWHGAGIVDNYVIAWMPLPEPYEGVDE